MEYTLTINLFYVLGLAVFAVLMYIYMKDDGDDRLTHLRHDIEMKKEWFRMLAKQKTSNPTWPEEWEQKSK
jgi:hypothetical protein